MKRHKRYNFTLLLLSICACFLLTSESTLAAGGLSVVSVSPSPRSLDAFTESVITVQFDNAVNPSTIDGDSFWAFGRWSGLVGGTYSFADGNQTVILTPSEPFSAGEQVMVILSNQIEGADGSSLRDGGYSFQFWTRVALTFPQFEPIDTFSTRTTPSQSTRSYGGVATDFDNDGWLDLSIVNEDSADVRVFLNRADGTGLYHDFIDPPAAVNDRASPSEPSDFNNDGNADLAVANINTNSVSILLGQGDGTFTPQQEVNVGSAPRGIAVLDVDGDGDTDIVNTNSGGVGNLSLLLNKGNGTFGLPTFFEGGAANEWALAAGDMNEDGILDLVIGTQNAGSPTVLVHAGNGDGTFSLLSTQSATGGMWMLNVADVNGDAHEDVVVVNNSQNQGSVFLGSGDGTLSAPTTVATDPFPLATDLGDVDGDGDLDWVTSSFSGDWKLFINNGQGEFSLGEEFLAPIAASCALMLDIDNDHDLDLALIDELADEVIIVENTLGGVTANTLTQMNATSDNSYIFAGLSVLLLALGGLWRRG